MALPEDLRSEFLKSYGRDEFANYHRNILKAVEIWRRLGVWRVPIDEANTHLFRGKTLGPSPPPARLARRKAHCSQHRRTAEVAGHPIKIERKNTNGKVGFHN
jgi:hypothetical protein